MSEVDPARSIDEVLDLFERFGQDHYDESISQLDHALQTAALAVAARAADELVVAALLHDVGHLLELRAGNRHDATTELDHGHEASGARYLRKLFGPGVTGPIALHVRAKRYRCAVDPDYAASLSTGSTASLARQGGPLRADEAEAFAAGPGARDAVLLREWDDSGKVEGLAIPALDSYRVVLELAAR